MVPAQHSAHKAWVKTLKIRIALYTQLARNIGTGGKHIQFIVQRIVRDDLPDAGGIGDSGEQGFKKIAADTEEIEKRYKKNNGHTQVKTQLQQQYGFHRSMLINPLRTNGTGGIKIEETDGDNGIVVAVDHKCMPGGTHVGYALAVNNKCGDVPHHNEYTGGAAQQHHADEADLAKIFRGKEE